MLKFYIKVFRTSLFLNSVVYLFHVWHYDRCWSKILCSTIPKPVYDFKVKVICNPIFYNFSFFAKPSMDFIYLWRDDGALSNILHTTIPSQYMALRSGSQTLNSKMLHKGKAQLQASFPVRRQVLFFPSKR